MIKYNVLYIANAEHEEDRLYEKEIAIVDHKFFNHELYGVSRGMDQFAIVRKNRKYYCYDVKEQVARYTHPIPKDITLSFVTFKTKSEAIMYAMSMLE